MTEKGKRLKNCKIVLSYLYYLFCSPAGHETEYRDVV